MTAAVALLGLVVALLAVLVVSLLRSHAEILRALHDLGQDLDPSRPATRSVAGVDPATTGDFTTAPGVPSPAAALGTPAHDVVGIDPSGDAVSIGVVGAPRSTLLAFLTSGCTACMAFWKSFATGVELPSPDMRLVVVTKGEEAESPSTIAGLADPRLEVVMSTDAWEDYGVPVAPYFVLVDGEQVVGEGAAGTWPQVVDLLGKSLADQGRAMGRTGPRSRRAFLTGRDRADRVDADLAAAGLGPGDPRLHHTPDDVGTGDVVADAGRAEEGG